MNLLQANSGLCPTLARLLRGNFFFFTRSPSLSVSVRFLLRSFSLPIVRVARCCHMPLLSPRPPLCFSLALLTGGSETVQIEFLGIGLRLATKVRLKTTASVSNRGLARTPLPYSHAATGLHHNFSHLCFNSAPTRNTVFLAETATVCFYTRDSGSVQLRKKVSH